MEWAHGWEARETMTKLSPHDLHPPQSDFSPTTSAVQPCSRFFLPSTNSSAAVGDKHTGPEGGFLCYLIFSVFPPSSPCHRGARHKLSASVLIFTFSSFSAVRRRLTLLLDAFSLLLFFFFVAVSAVCGKALQMVAAGGQTSLKRRRQPH